MSSVYFGNSNYQTWIKAPASGMKSSANNWSNQGTLLSGRGYIKRSAASHRKFDMSWVGPMNDEDLEKSLQTIKDFYDGLYGDGPFFWNDPYATASNMFSPAWAAPGISIDSDWEAIFADAAPVARTKVTTASLSGSLGNNTNNYPLYTASYSAPGSTLFQGQKFTFYIPEDYTLWLGFHGTVSSSGGAFVQPYSRTGSAGTPVSLTPLGVNTTTRVNSSYSGSSYGKVEFYLAKTTSDACTFNVNALVAQILPSSTTPAVGAFMSGRGTTGLEFSSGVNIDYYSAAVNNGQIGLSTSFIEV